MQSEVSNQIALCLTEIHQVLVDIETGGIPKRHHLQDINQMLDELVGLIEKQESAVHPAEGDKP